jgi:UDP-N-acetylmuramate dehydrogenase
MPAEKKMSVSTDNDPVSAALTAELPALQREAPLAPLCAYGVGGPAEYLYTARSQGELERAVSAAHELGVPLTVLGQATNVLIADAGLRGLVVLTRNEAATLDGELLTVGAGAVVPELVTGLAEEGLGGLEFAGNIPGSVGGAVVGNAGAYGRDVAGALVAASVLVGGAVRSLGAAQLGMAYRTTALKRRELDGVVLAATFALHGGERGKLLAEIARDAELRRSKHPLEYASCGSYFKNPSRETPAAALIERAGLKGFALGGASVSVKHANFLVAAPGCRADEIRALAVEVKRRVFETTGVRLQEEVVHLGFAAAPA